MNVKVRTKQIDELGRIVIPKDIRKALSISSQDEVEISLDQDQIMIKKATKSCVFCSAKENLINYRGGCICKNCLNELSKS